MSLYSLSVDGRSIQQQPSRFLNPIFFRPPQLWTIPCSCCMDLTLLPTSRGAAAPSDRYDAFLNHGEAQYTVIIVYHYFLFLHSFK